MNTFICPFTGKKSIEYPKEYHEGHFNLYWYHISLENKKINFRICSTFFNELSLSNSEVRTRIEDARIVLLKEFLKDDFNIVRKNVLHWDCPKLVHTRDHLLVKPYLESLDLTHMVRASRKEKVTNLILHFYNRLGQDDTLFTLNDDLDLWISLGFNSFDELKFYLQELSNDGKIKLGINSLTISFQFTLSGLEYCEQLIAIIEDDSVEKDKYDIGLSFAGEQRPFIELVASSLRDKGLKVFYDDYETTNLWGKDLYQHLSDVYQNKCKYCIIFISKEYAGKLWTRHELKNAQARAFKENREYILPVRFDNTVLPGITDTVSYISAENYSEVEIAELVYKKLTSL